MDYYDSGTRNSCPILVYADQTPREMFPILGTAASKRVMDKLEQV